MTPQEVDELRRKLRDLEGKTIDTVLLLEVEATKLLELRILTKNRQLLVCRMDLGGVWEPMALHGPS
ncbi:MAG: hypothetical protein ACE5PO_07305 [Candidatus Bathyarchaeia archaeon]